METIRMGIIGAGGISRGHGKRLIARGDVRIAALAEPSEDMVRLFNETVLPAGPAPKVYKDHRALLAGEELDAVLIASPHTLHFRQIMDSLDAGLHVLAEKPMVCTVEEAEKVVRKAESAGRHVVVSYQRRFLAQFRYMRQFIRDPAFGRLFVLSVVQTQGWWTSQRGTWRQDPALSGGGQLNDSGSHVVDVMNWILPDPVVEVTAFCDNRGTAVDIDSVLCFRTAAGALGSITILGSAQHRGFCEDWTLSGDGGRTLLVRQDGAPLVIRASAELGGELQDVADFGGCTGTDPDNHFIEVIQGRATNESPPENFLPTIRFTHACWRSAAKGGRPVRIKDW